MVKIKKLLPVNPVRNLVLPARKCGISNGVKLVIGFIFQKKSVVNKAESILEKEFGKIDYESQSIGFTYTDYYEPELGRNLKRKFIAFAKLIPPQSLAKIKVLTNSIEKKLSRMGLRLINIDPGYLDMARLILASTKDYKHRICLNKGIYAEVTLFYGDRTFHPWEWTYPDYRAADYISVFNQIRDIYALQIKNK